MSHSPHNASTYTTLTYQVLLRPDVSAAFRRLISAAGGRGCASGSRVQARSWRVVVPTLPSICVSRLLQSVRSQRGNTDFIVETSCCVCGGGKAWLYLMHC